MEEARNVERKPWYSILTEFDDEWVMEMRGPLFKLATALLAANVRILSVLSRDAVADDETRRIRILDQLIPSIFISMYSSFVTMAVVSMGGGVLMRSKILQDIMGFSVFCSLINSMRCYVEMGRFWFPNYGDHRDGSTLSSEILTPGVSLLIALLILFQVCRRA